MAAPTAETNWLGHGSHDAWRRAHFASLGIPYDNATEPTAPKTTGSSKKGGSGTASYLLSGLQSDSDKLAAAHQNNIDTRYGGQEPTYEVAMANSKSRRWYNRQKLVRDEGLHAQGYSYYQGDPSTSEADMRAAGYITNAEAGGVGGSSANSWYLAPKEAAPAPAAGPSQASGGGGGGRSSTAPAAPAAPAYKAPPPPPPPPIFRSNVKTGAEAGSDFKMFMGGKFANKLGMTADSLRIGGAAARGTTRDIEKKKQLNTLGLNIASPMIGLGI